MTKKEYIALQQKIKSRKDRLKANREKMQFLNAELKRLEKELVAEKQKGEEASATKLTSLGKKVDSVTSSQQTAATRIVTAEAEINDFVRELVVDPNPRTQVAQLGDDLPILLLPVRVEARFMTIKHIARVNPVIGVSTRGGTAVKEVFSGTTELPVVDDRKELWVRIFPDDIAVHNHESTLTEEELTAAQNYWTEIWYAGDDENLRLGAWRALVGSRGPERAAWISRQMEPTNPNLQPATPTPREDPLPEDPTFPTPDTKERAWTVAGHSRVMPDRFVVRLQRGTAVREVTGNAIPDPLQLTIEPSETETFDTDDGKLVFPEKLKWLTDFKEAEKVGMGIRIALSTAEAAGGFDRLLVLGVKTSANAETSQELLEELIDSHHFTDGGFSLVPQGSATNNTKESGTIYTQYNDDDDTLFNLEMGDPQFTSTTNESEKTDGQFLADALGIEYEVVDRLKYANQKDIKEGIAMNRALWPATLGYYLSQMMHPIFSNQEVNQTRSHFNRFVLGRGRVPAIRVDDQPYGILPTTAFSKWKYTDTSSTSRYLDKLHNNVLKNMEQTWTSLSAQVAHAHQTGGNPDDRFLEIMGLHASSIEYYQRFAGGPYFIWNVFNFGQHLREDTLQTKVSYASTLDFFQQFQLLNFLFVQPPRVFDLIYGKEPKFLTGAVIDELPLSETRLIKELVPDWNYVRWLRESSFNEILEEDFSGIGLSSNTPPTALLYLLLRHAYLLEYTQTGGNILVSNNLISDVALLDTEVINMVGANSLQAEREQLLRAQLNLREGLKMERKIEKVVDKEFQKRLDQGLLKGMSLRELEAEKAIFRDAQRQSNADKLATKVEGEMAKAAPSGSFEMTNRRLLDESYAEITEGLSLNDYLDKQLGLGTALVKNLTEVKNAMACLENIPTARLERAFAEHIDLANYRLDAWFYSLVAERLERRRKSTTSNRKKGIYLGAFSWLLDLRPGSFPGVHYEEVTIENDTIRIEDLSDLTFEVSKDGLGDTRLPLGPSPELQIETELTGNQTIRLTEKVSTVQVKEATTMVDNISIAQLKRYVYLGRNGEGNIVYDSINDRYIAGPRVDTSNLGYIHAPSINHATAAAVLRAAYESHKQNTGSPDNSFAINLNSERVRRSLNYLEGIKNGQELGALLGYQFERALHDITADTTNTLNLSQYVYDIRQEFPQIAGSVTDNSSVVDVTTAEAYSVVDGLKLLEAYRDDPGGWDSNLTFSPASDKNSVVEQIDKLADSLDAINDLMMSESIYQTILGNHTRAGAALNVLNGTGAPVEPEVINTPRRYNVLTQRFGVQMDMSAGGEQAWTGIDATLRSLAEPHLNRWLSELLPAPGNIAVNVDHRLKSAAETDPFTTTKITMDLLGLQPIDLYYLLAQPSEEGEVYELTRLVNYYLRDQVATTDDIDVEVKFMDRTGFATGDFSVFELMPLFQQLKIVVGQSRPLDPKDFLLDSEVSDKVSLNPGGGYEVTSLEARLTNVLATTMTNSDPGAKGVQTNLENALTPVEQLDFDNLPGNEATLLDTLRAAIRAAAFLGIPGAVPSTGQDYSDSNATDLVTRAKAILIDLDKRITEADNLMVDVAAASDADSKVKLLMQVGQKIFGRPFKVFPEFQQYDATTFSAAQNYPDFLADAGDNAQEEWMQTISFVRPRMGAWHKAKLFSYAIAGQEKMDTSILQWPLLPLDNANNVAARWLGTSFPADYEIPDENLSVVLQLPSGFTASTLQAGFLLDEWNEELPVQQVETGVSVHYNNPDSAPPQACLLAVTPEETGSWSWDDLMDTLNETIDWSKKRAVDPDLISKTPYAQVLPGVMAALSGSEEVITLDFARNMLKNPISGKFPPVILRDYQVLDAVPYTAEYKGPLIFEEVDFFAGD